MKLRTEIQIDASREKIWQVITNIEETDKHISGIESLEVLHKPDHGLVGLKWKETRTLFGKTAEETMWITEAEDNSHYNTRAESHGMIYTSQIGIVEKDGRNYLYMDFGGKPTTLMARTMGAIMGPLFKGATRKALLQDLNDIKTAVEAPA